MLQISRYLKQNLITLSMETTTFKNPDGDAPPHKILTITREAVLWELVDLLSHSGMVSNSKKLFRDFHDREKKASTAIGHGVAIPHVRTMQVREFLMGFVRSEKGVEFGSPDRQPVHIFFPMVAPPYDDSFYLKVFKSLAEVLRFKEFRKKLLSARKEYEIIRAFKEMGA